MSNAEIANLLRDVAAAMLIKSEREHQYQILAYQRAADVIQNHPVQAHDLYTKGALDQLPGIGARIKNHLIELFTTGKVAHFDEILESIPQSVFH
jgi:DNA polymerase (family X)